MMEHKKTGGGSMEGTRGMLRADLEEWFGRLATGLPRPNLIQPKCMAELLRRIGRFDLMEEALRLGREDPSTYLGIVWRAAWVAIVARRREPLLSDSGHEVDE